MSQLSVGSVLSRVADMYRRAAPVLLAVALAFYLVVALITAAVLSGRVSLAFLLVSSLIGVVAGFWYQAMVVEIVRDLRSSDRLQPVGQLFASVRPRIGAVLGVGLLAGIAIAIGFVLIIVPGLILLTLWALIVPVLILERGRALDAFQRSRELVRGNGWPVFGVIVVIYLVTFVVQQIFRSVGGTSFVGLFLTSLIPSVLVAPLGALAASIMYFDLRELKGEPAVGEGSGQAAVLETPVQRPRPPGGPGVT